MPLEQQPVLTVLVVIRLVIIRYELIIFTNEMQIWTDCKDDRARVR